MKKLFFAMMILVIAAIALIGCAPKQPNDDNEEPPEEPVKVESVEFVKDSYSTSVGKTVDIYASVSPYNAVNLECTWESSDTSIATVSGPETARAAGGNTKATVTGVKAGTVTITFTCGGKTDTTEVKVAGKVDKATWEKTLDDLLTMTGTITIDEQDGGALSGTFKKTEIRITSDKAYVKDDNGETYYQLADGKIDSYTKAKSATEYTYKSESITMDGLKVRLLKTLKDTLEKSFTFNGKTGTLKSLYDEFAFDVSLYRLDDGAINGVDGSSCDIYIYITDGVLETMMINETRPRVHDLTFNFDNSAATIEIPSEALSTKTAQ